MTAQSYKCSFLGWRIESIKRDCPLVHFCLVFLFKSMSILDIDMDLMLISHGIGSNLSWCCLAFYFFFRFQWRARVQWGALDINYTALSYLQFKLPSCISPFWDAAWKYNPPEGHFDAAVTTLTLKHIYQGSCFRGHPGTWLLLTSFTGKTYDLIMQMQTFALRTTK